MIADTDDVRQEVGCHVYGVVRPADDEVCDGVVGLEGAPTRLVTHGPVAAVVSDLRLERPPGRRADLMAYNAVLEALAKAGPVVPVRFGSILVDEQDVVEQLLGPHEKHLDALLEELAGRAQFQLRATYQPDVALAEVVAADPRVARLREATRDRSEEEAYGDRVRLGELVASNLETKREDDTALLLDVILPFVADHRVRLGAGVDDLAEITMLVDDEVRERFEQQLEGLAEELHERIRLRLVGPLPPYDFVGDI